MMPRRMSRMRVVASYFCIKNIATYPDKIASDAMRDGLLKYASQAVAEQDPVGAEQLPGDSLSAMNQLLGLIDGIIPDSRHEEILYAQILINLNELSKYRNLRYQAMHEELPSAIWIGVVVGAIITTSFTFLFGTENVWAHIIMMSLLAALIAVVVYVVIEMDHPAMGEVNIGFPRDTQKSSKSRKPSNKACRLARTVGRAHSEPALSKTGFKASSLHH